MDMAKIRDNSIHISPPRPQAQLGSISKNVKVENTSCEQKQKRNNKFEKKMIFTLKKCWLPARKKNKGHLLEDEQRYARKSRRKDSQTV